MDLIYMSDFDEEIGVLKDYELDFDTADKKDFVLKCSLSGTILNIGYIGYIPGTEYGGKIEGRKIDTKNNRITYSGRNWRGILASKIIEPPNGDDYLEVTGAVSTIATTLLTTAGINTFFTVTATAATVTAYKFPRYITLYEGLTRLAVEAGLVVSLAYSDSGIVISFPAQTDYSSTVEYSQDYNADFILEDKQGGVNHLVCLGSGQLSARDVLHLYVQEDGTIDITPYYTGIYDISDVLDYPNAESSADLEAAGRKKLAEAKNKKTFSLSVEDLDLKIGDIVGARDRITNTEMTAEVTNIIVKIKEGIVKQKYTVG